MFCPLNLLLIEDDTIECIKFEKALQALHPKHKLTHLSNGAQALAYLNREPSFPDVILLDLHMPKINGMEFLAMTQKHEVLRNIPKVVLTTSTNSSELKKCYALGAAGYIVKPLKYEDYMAKIEQIIGYWTINERIPSYTKPNSVAK